MSNFLGIATVTEAVRQMLEQAIQPDFKEALNEATVTAIRPNSGATLPKLGVNLYLYQVGHNASLRNADLPTRRGDGSLRQAPRAALDLHYLFSFYGDETRLEPQQVMGSVIRTLHASPFLLQKQIAHIIETSDPLNKSDLDLEIERIKLTPLPLTIEELSKIWSVFFQNSYTLSMAYAASVVFIEGRELPKAPLPVKARNVYALPFQFPVIDEVMSQAGLDDPPVATQRFTSESRLFLAGSQLRSDKTTVKIDGREIAPVQIQEIKNDHVTITLPADLRAGVHSISIAHRLMIGEPPEEHPGSESNSAAFLLCPSISLPAGPIIPTVAADNGHSVYTLSITVGFNPPCGRNQRIHLLLNEYREISDKPQIDYRLDAPENNGVSDLSIADTSAVTFDLIMRTKPKAGRYFARVSVDGAQSPVIFDPAGPLVEIADVP